MESLNNLNDFKTKYIELLEIIINHSKIEKLDKITNLKQNITNEDIELLSARFIKSLEKHKKLKKLFLNRNERVFSDKNGVKLVPSLNLKTIILSLDDENKKKIWDCIQILYAIYRTGDEKYGSYINSLVTKIEECKNLKNTSEIEVTSEPKNNKKSKAENMIMDIAGSLRKSLIENSQTNDSGNPLENMLKTSQQIAQKYASDLQSGNISMNDMFSSLGSMMGKIEEDTKNDKNVDNINLENMPKPNEILEKMGLGKDFNPESIVENLQNNKFNPLDMIGKMFGGKKNDEDEELTEKQISEMEDFYNNLTTEDMEGLENINEDEKKGGLNIGNIIKGIAGGKEGGGIGNVLGALTGGSNGGGLGQMLGNLGKNLMKK